MFSREVPWTFYCKMGKQFLPQHLLKSYKKKKSRMIRNLIRCPLMAKKKKKPHTHHDYIYIIPTFINRLETSQSEYCINCQNIGRGGRCEPWTPPSQRIKHHPYMRGNSRITYPPHQGFHDKNVKFQ